MKKNYLFAAVLAAFFMLTFFGLTAYAAESSLPSGTATVIDYNTDSDGRLFYTIMTPDEYVFYLIIDKNSSTDNVYFLNVVTVDELLPLAEKPAQVLDIPAVTLPIPTEPAEKPTEPSLPVENTQGSNIVMFVVIGLLVAIGGVVGWYFKIYRPKQQNANDSDEYAPSDSVSWEKDEESGDKYDE